MEEQLIKLHTVIKAAGYPDANTELSTFLVARGMDSTEARELVESLRPMLTAAPGHRHSFLMEKNAIGTNATAWLYLNSNQAILLNIRNGPLRLVERLTRKSAGAINNPNQNK